MQRLGRVLHISSSRYLILKAESLPRIGDKVVDENLKTVGTVFDILGPVSSPYISIKPIVADPQRLVKNMLYKIPFNMRRKEKRKYGR